MNKDQRGTNYAAILADLEAKRLALDAAIASLRAALATGALGDPSEISATAPNAPRSPGEPMPLPRGALLGKSATDAIKLYLGAVMKKQTNKEIGDALKQGGVESTSKSFDTFINSALFRLKGSGELLRFDDGWGLSEWYPESFRTRVTEKAANGAKRKPKKKAALKGKTKVKPAEAETKSAVPKPAKKMGLDAEIMDIFNGSSGTADASMLAEACGVSEKTINLALGRLRSKNKLEKTQQGWRLQTGNIKEMPTTKAS